MSLEFTPVSLTKDDLETVISHPEEATPEQLLAAEGILTLQSQRAEERLKRVVAARQALSPADLLSVFGGNFAIKVNGSVVVSVARIKSEDLVYDQKAMNDPHKAVESAPYREHRYVLKPDLIKKAIRDGTFPPEFHGSITEVEKTNVYVGEAKDYE